VGLKRGWGRGRDIRREGWLRQKTVTTSFYIGWGYIWSLVYVEGRKERREGGKNYLLWGVGHVHSDGQECVTAIGKGMLFGGVGGGVGGVLVGWVGGGGGGGGQDPGKSVGLGLLQYFFACSMWKK